MAPRPDAPADTVKFKVGTHAVQITKAEGRWTATVDGTPCPSQCATEADAWLEGVREADRIDRADGRS